MQQDEKPSYRANECSVATAGSDRAANLSWDFADDEGDSGNCRIALRMPDGSSLPIGYYDDATGNIFDSPDASEGASDANPAIRIVGSLEGNTGLVTIRQPDGDYRRFSRWDRISKGSPAQPDAIVRTLPQCGCGGSLGMPKLFDSFRDMSMYFFTTFFFDSGNRDS